MLRVVVGVREYLEVAQHVRIERISRFQVTGEDGRPGAALIGVRHDRTSATIYATRALTTEDILHELLHVAYPEWSETAVVAETTRLWRHTSQRRRWTGLHATPLRARLEGPDRRDLEAVAAS